MPIPRTVLCALLMLLPGIGLAEQARGVGQYIHQRWHEGSEAPVPVVSIAQGLDGFLWLATGDGLFRFDGVRYERIDADPPLGNDAPSAVMVARGGEVWVALEPSHRFAVYRDGVLRVLGEPAAPSRIVGMAEGNDGAIWALTSNYNAEALRFRDSAWRTFDARDGLPASNAAHMLVARDGTVWIAGSAGVASLRPGAERFAMHRTPSSARVSQDAQGRIWISDSSGTYPIEEPVGTEVAARAMLRFLTGGLDILGAPVFDRQGNLWIATRHQGVQRFPSAHAQVAARDAAHPESITTREGLTSDLTNVIAEDREGSVWIGTQGGLDRLRAAALVRDPALRTPARFGDKLLAGSDGTVYIGQADTIFRVAPQGAPEPIVRGIHEPEALCQAPDGALWIALRDHVLVWSSAQERRTVVRPDRDATHNIAYDCAFDARGDYWLSAAGGGVHRHRDGRWERIFDGGSDADLYPTTMAAHPDGGVVFQSGDRLVRSDGGTLSISQLDFRGSPPRVLTMHAVGGVIHLAGAFGLSRDRAGTLQTMHARDPSPDSRINGLAQEPNGDLWLAYPKALAKISAAQLEQGFADGVLPPPTLTLGRGDGLINRPHSHSQRAMVAGGDGRLWIATEAGTVWMDPQDIPRNTTPPGIAITALRDDAGSQRDPRAVRLEPATSKLEIDYAVPGFADQQRLQVRYRLVGFDEDWVDPGTRRQAFYTNLPPGSYRFELEAGNDDGVWNPRQATLDIDIPKAFFQTGWFYLACFVSAMAALVLLHRVRLARAAEHVRKRLEERHAERERIARELHDTLLQGVMGLILRFQSVANRIARDDPHRAQLESALVSADAVVVDARNRVLDLRGDGDAEDLPASIRRIAADAHFIPPIPVSTRIEGQARPLHPLVAAEVGRIVGEGLLNIAQHAQARSADVAIAYGKRDFVVRITDDGAGFTQQVLAHGRKHGHFGLVGMRERAERIGGTLRIGNLPERGAEVMLVLPARLAYVRRMSRIAAWWRSWIRMEETA